MTSRECFDMKYIGKYLSGEILLTVSVDLKFGSNEFHKRKVDGKNDLENISKRHLGTLYCNEFLRL
jgi:hypothetical protein